MKNSLHNTLYFRRVIKYFLLYLLFCIGVNTYAQNTSCTAQALTLGTSCSVVTYDNSSLTNSGQSPSCALYGNGPDMWFTVTVPLSGEVSIQTSTANSGTLGDLDMEVYSGTCGSLTSIDCTDDGSNISGSNQYDAGLELTGQTPGATLWIQVWEYGSGTRTGTFEMCAFDPNPVIINDDPCTSTSLVVRCTPIYTSDSNVGVTNSSIPNPGCGNYQGGDKWYSFTAPGSGQVIIDAIAGTMTNGAMALYSATSCSSLTLVECDANDGTGQMPRIDATGLTAGDTYYIRFWEQGNNVTGTYQLTIYDTTQAYCLHGDAIIYTPPGHLATDGCAQMTADLNNQSGQVWSSSQIDFSSDFDYEFTMYFGASTGGADGCTFTFQNQGPNAIGIDGNQLGAGGISNSVVIEFDSYDNEPTGTRTYEISNDHVAVNVSGDLTDPVGQICGPIQIRIGGGNIDDGNEFPIRVNWDASTQTMGIYFNTHLRISCTHDFVNNVFGGDPTVYWGFTGATGGLTNQHYFCPGNLPLPIDIMNFKVICSNGKNTLSWYTPNHDNPNEFIVQRSTDGKNFDDIDVLDASYDNEFVWEDDNSDFYFYRLKQNTHKGVPKYTSTIQSKCGENYFNMNSVSVDQNKININVTSNYDQEAIVNIINSAGAIVSSYDKTISKGQNNFSFINNLSQGFYYVEMKTSFHTTGKKLLVLPTE